MTNVPKSRLGIKVAKNGPTIPYLMFADDFMIFCRATKSAARNVKTILKNYCNVLGQLVNCHKSMVQFLK